MITNFGYLCTMINPRAFFLKEATASTSSSVNANLKLVVHIFVCIFAASSALFSVKKSFWKQDPNKRKLLKINFHLNCL